MYVRVLLQVNVVCGTCEPTRSPRVVIAAPDGIHRQLLQVANAGHDRELQCKKRCVRRTFTKGELLGPGKLSSSPRHTLLLQHDAPTSSSSLGSRCVPWLGEGLSMSSPNDPVLCFPLSYRVAPVFVQVVSPPLGWSPLTSFLVIWSPSGDARSPTVVFEAVDMPCPGPFHFSHSVDYIYEFCPLPNPDVGPSIFVCDDEHTSFHFGLCGRKFVLCLFGQCPGLCTICHGWQHTGVVHLSLQADGKVACEDIPVFGVCRPACHDSSLYLFVLVLFLEAVVLSQVHIAWDIFYQQIVHVYKGAVYNHHLCLCDVHLKTHSSTFIGQFLQHLLQFLWCQLYPSCAILVRLVCQCGFSRCYRAS